MKKPLRIIVQETDNDFRFFLEKNITADSRFTLVSSVKTLNAMTDFAGLLSIGILLIGWHHPKKQFYDFITAHTDKFPGIKIIVTFDFVQPDFAYNAIKSGASGFLLKPFMPDDILHPENIFIHNSKLKFHLLKLKALI